jgi:hypothetical protein
MFNILPERGEIGTVRLADLDDLADFSSITTANLWSRRLLPDAAIAVDDDCVCEEDVNDIRGYKKSWTDEQYDLFIKVIRRKRAIINALFPIRPRR